MGTSNSNGHTDEFDRNNAQGYSPLSSITIKDSSPMHRWQACFNLSVSEGHDDEEAESSLKPTTCIVLNETYTTITNSKRLRSPDSSVSCHHPPLRPPRTRHAATSVVCHNAILSNRQQAKASTARDLMDSAYRRSGAQRWHITYGVS